MVRGIACDADANHFRHSHAHGAVLPQSTKQVAGDSPVFTVVAIGVVITISPLAHILGFTPLPWKFFAVLGAFVITYLVLVELAKVMFYAEPINHAGLPHRTRGHAHRIRRRAARFHYVNGVSATRATYADVTR